VRSILSGLGRSGGNGKLILGSIYSGHHHVDQDEGMIEHITSRLVKTEGCAALRAGAIAAMRRNADSAAAE
jgi:hypothetical protein